jgi:hypothetical protein
MLSMSGSSVAAPDSVGWVTDFLNAAYYARPARERSLEDLRLAWAILTTRWHRRGEGRLHADDVLDFHRAFGRRRLDASPFATLDGQALLAGACDLLGDWFAASWESSELRGWGVVFEDADDRASFRPERRLESAPLGVLTAPSAAPAKRRWHTYPPVPVRSVEATRAALLDPPRWPDFGSELGRFTPVRSTGLTGQTFEIEIVVRPLPRAPLVVRAYVTATRVLIDADELAGFAASLNERLQAAGADLRLAVPPGARPLLGLELTTHEGHFVGAARSNIVLFADGEKGFVRDVGQWDPMPLHLRVAYRTAGARAQQAFWGGDAPEASMLHQFASAT